MSTSIPTPEARWYGSSLLQLSPDHGPLPGLTYAPPTNRALDVQEGGDHYKNMAIQPFEYIHANRIGFAEGCAIKYLSRWKAKGGIEDLKKARHFIDMLIEAEEKEKCKLTPT